MAQPGAGGAVVYSPQCRVPVEAGNIHVVSAEPPCSASTEYLLIGAAVVAAGVGGAIILLNDDDDNKPTSP